jgi:hypothetical protein
MSIDRTAERVWAFKDFGTEIFEVKPVKFGGNPTDPRNKIKVDRKTHIQLVRYWNRLLHDVTDRGERKD